MSLESFTEHVREWTDKPWKGLVAAIVIYAIAVVAALCSRSSLDGWLGAFAWASAVISLLAGVVEYFRTDQVDAAFAMKYWVLCSALAIAAIKFTLG